MAGHARSPVILSEAKNPVKSWILRSRCDLRMTGLRAGQSIVRDLVVGQVPLQFAAEALSLDLKLEGAGEELQPAARL